MLYRLGTKIIRTMSANKSFPLIFSAEPFKTPFILIDEEKLEYFEPRLPSLRQDLILPLWKDWFQY